ncbi:hypothetical protein OAK54_03225, partial [Akkermansiaceae bacterium]|nr:hypothetical protein [Akkermansiaceae bacterium]
MNTNQLNLTPNTQISKVEDRDGDLNAWNFNGSEFFQNTNAYYPELEISFWVKPAQGNPPYSTIFGFGNSDGWPSYSLNLNSITYDEQSGIQESRPVTIPADQWSFVSFQISQHQLSGNFNGQEVQFENPNPGATSSANLIIGTGLQSWISEGDKGFLGQISDLKVNGSFYGASISQLESKLWESNANEEAVADASSGLSGDLSSYIYQWYFEDTLIPISEGGSAATYNINGVPQNEGTWKVLISDRETIYERTFEYRIFVDTDGDGLSDYREQNLTNTNFEVVDTDEDGLSDGAEVALGTDPLLVDTDEDGFSDSFEAEVLLTDPKISNSVHKFDGIPSELVAYWPLDSSEGSITRDLGPYGYDLELRNMDSTNFVIIEGRSAVTLDGVEEFLLRESSADDMLPISKNSRFTISMWVKVIGTDQRDTRLFSESSRFNNNPLFNIGTHNYGNNNAIDIYLRDGDSPNHQYSNAEPLDGSWHNIVYTHDDSTQTAQLYVDGVLDRDDWVFKDVDSPEVNLTTIGAILRGSPSNWTNGSIDDVMLWSTVLTPTQITEIFSGSVFTSDSLSRLYESNANEEAVVDASSGLSGDLSSYIYQWYFEDTLIPSSEGGSGATYNINGVPQNEGTWKVLISDRETIYEKTFEYRIFVDTDGDGL